VTAAAPRGARRWTLHPLTPTLVLIVSTLAGAAAVLTGVPASGALLACAAGCAAGFANSGST
jgi:hypothetical protein